MKDDTISRAAALKGLEDLNIASFYEENEHSKEAYKEVKQMLSALPSAQPDAVTASLEELINDYGEDGFFIVDGVNYRAYELLSELKTNSSVGEKFRKQIIKTIVQYFMKFGG